jgi:hypothetical protein
MPHNSIPHTEIGLLLFAGGVSQLFEQFVLKVGMTVFAVVIAAAIGIIFKLWFKPIAQRWFDRIKKRVKK